MGSKLSNKMLDMLSQERLKKLLKSERDHLRVDLSNYKTLTGEFYWKVFPDDNSFDFMKDRYDTHKAYIREIKSRIHES